MSPPVLVHLAVWVPFLAAIPLLQGAVLPRPLWKGIAAVGFAVPLVAAILLAFAYEPLRGAEYFAVSSYDAGLGAAGIHLAFGLNGISYPLFALAAVVGFAAGLFALQSSAERHHLYVLLLLVMQGGLMGVFASTDLVFFYFFHEVAMIPTFLMIGIWGGRDRHYAAIKVAVYLTLGALFSLAGLILLVVESGAGTWDMVALRQHLAAVPLDEGWQGTIFGMLLFGFGTLVSLFPLHTWAPLGYAAAPTGAAMLHAGVLKKFGLYGFVQVALPLLPAGALGWSGWLTTLALANILVIGGIALDQRDLKQLIGYSSVMHMGYAFLGIAAASALGAGAAVLLMVAHGLTVALLFLCATVIHQRTGTLEMEDMGGLGRRTPVLALFFTAAMLANVGLPGPGLANFWSELLVFISLYETRGWLVIAAAAGVVISAVYGLRAIAAIFHGPESAEMTRQAAAREVRDLTWPEKLPAILLLGAMLALGFWPRMVTDGVHAALGGGAHGGRPGVQAVLVLPEAAVEVAPAFPAPTDGSALVEVSR